MGLALYTPFTLDSIISATVSSRAPPHGKISAAVPSYTLRRAQEVSAFCDVGPLVYYATTTTLIGCDYSRRRPLRPVEVCRCPTPRPVSPPPSLYIPIPCSRMQLFAVLLSSRGVSFPACSTLESNRFGVQPHACFHRGTVSYVRYGRVSWRVTKGSLRSAPVSRTMSPALSATLNVAMYFFWALDVSLGPSC